MTMGAVQAMMMMMIMVMEVIMMGALFLLPLGVESLEQPVHQLVLAHALTTTTDTHTHHGLVTHHGEAFPEEGRQQRTDADTAFLQSDLTEEIYLKQPPGFEQHGPGGEQMVWGLNKSLYRCGVSAAPTWLPTRRMAVSPAT